MESNNLTESLELKEIAVKATTSKLLTWIRACKNAIQMVVKLGYEKETSFVKLIDSWNLRINIYSTELSSRGVRNKILKRCNHKLYI